MKLENLPRATDLAAMRKNCEDRITTLNNELRLLNSGFYLWTDYSKIGENGLKALNGQQKPTCNKIKLGESGGVVYLDTALILDVLNKQVLRLQERIKEIDKELELL